MRQRQSYCHKKLQSRLGQWGGGVKPAPTLSWGSADSQMMQHAPLEFSLFSLIHCFTEVTYTAEHGCLRCSVPQAGTTLDTRKISYIFSFHQPPKSFVLLSGHPHVHDAPCSDFYCCLYRYSLQFMLNASWTASFYTITTTVYLLVHGICQAPHPHKCPNHH